MNIWPCFYHSHSLKCGIEWKLKSRIPFGSSQEVQYVFALSLGGIV